MILIGYVFPKLRTEKDVVRKVSKNARFRRPFDKRHIKRSQTLSKFEQQQPYVNQHIHWLTLMKFNCKKSFLVICKILGPFFNTLTAIVKYSLLIIGYLTQLIQIQLSQKWETLFWFCSIFVKFRSNFEHFEQ